MASTHFPADRRPQQIQNVDAALLALEEAGCRIDTAAEDIVNGVRDKTLGLLWTLIHQRQARLCLFPAGWLSVRQARPGPLRHLQHWVAECSSMHWDTSLLPLQHIYKAGCREGACLQGNELLNHPRGEPLIVTSATCCIHQ